MKKMSLPLSQDVFKYGFGSFQSNLKCEWWVNIRENWALDPFDFDN